MYFATCTFDLRNATQADYDRAYGSLQRLGFIRVVVGSKGERVVAPTTMTFGQFNGSDTASVRDALADAIQKSFAHLRLTAEIFVTVANDWAWAARRTS